MNTIESFKPIESWELVFVGTAPLVWLCFFVELM